MKTPRLLSVLQNRFHWPPPIWFMRQAGRYLPEYRKLRSQIPDFLDFCYSPDLAAETTLQPINRFDLDAAILFSDILVIPDALGQKVSFIENQGPVLEPVHSLKDIPCQDPEGWYSRLYPVYQAIHLVKTSLHPEKALIGFSGAPWTLACYMIDGQGGGKFPETRKLAQYDPGAFKAIIDCLGEVILFHLEGQIKAGVDCVQIFDSWAGLLPEDDFFRWCIQPTKQIVTRLKAQYPDIPVITFPRGAGSGYLEYVKVIRPDAISLDSTVSLPWACQNLQPLCPVQGNIDPLALVKGGNLLETVVDHLLQILGKKPLIVNLGHGMLPHTKIDHVEHLVYRVRHTCLVK